MRKQDVHKRTSGLAWDEIRLVLEIARAGSLSGAARALGVEHSTVFRRLEDIERRAGVAFFDRQRSGYVVNAQGQALVDAAEQMEQAALTAQRHVLGADARLEGSVRIATSELLAMHLLLPVLDPFQSAHPGIELELTVSGRLVDLTRRDADLALRATNAPPEHLVGSRLVEICYAVYGQAEHVEALASGSLESLPWIGYDESLASIAPARWMRETLPDIRPRLRCDSLVGMLAAVRAGLGVAALPVFAAAACGGLVRLSEPSARHRTGIWLLSHPDLRRNARVRALTAYLREAVPDRMTHLREGERCCRDPVQI